MSVEDPFVGPPGESDEEFWRILNSGGLDRDSRDEVRREILQCETSLLHAEVAGAMIARAQDFNSSLSVEQLPHVGMVGFFVQGSGEQSEKMVCINATDTVDGVSFLFSVSPVPIEGTSDNETRCALRVSPDKVKLAELGETEKEVRDPLVVARQTEMVKQLLSSRLVKSSFGEPDPAYTSEVIVEKESEEVDKIAAIGRFRDQTIKLLQELQREGRVARHADDHRPSINVSFQAYGSPIGATEDAAAVLHSVYIESILEYDGSDIYDIAITERRPHSPRAITPCERRITINGDEIIYFDGMGYPETDESTVNQLKDYFFGLADRRDPTR